ncbi:MAG: Processing protease [Microgenomates group bacterium GW2011_GWA1_48_10]|uniref:Peptidase M16 n=1 Tax=Candidatus Gottesmanbacteria bacterium RIFCSPHIGHO2_01_FULL_47_48 TaxID=1798381 RepID=A0A1F6A3W8_9BACT|nr:MAG: Processing protease [Microgenomates group bacterium GW2011_GWA1_48_10]OGG19379.1 MAG: hypothetical protein A2721_02525 [Candidatus Gottesmanbacteria bacterium RIFCSPHIGHO2_01_FULL_47_48]
MFTKAVFPNGLRYILAPMPQVKSATVLVMVEAGSRYENAKNNGVSHFLEHMMFKGTEKRPAKIEISRILDGIGASFNAFTSKEYTGFYVKAAAERLELITDVVSDIVLNSLYEAAEVEREKGVIIEEINMDEDEPASRVFQVFEKMVFSGSPLSMRVAGEKGTVAGMSREEIVRYVRKMYHSRSMVVTVAGQAGEKDLTNLSNLTNLVSRYFGGVPKGPENEFLPAGEGQKKAQGEIYEKKTEQAHFVLGMRGYSLSDPRRYAAAILGNILGGNMSSRLFQEVREKRGLAYYVSAFAEEYLDTGVFGAAAGVKIEKVEEAIKVVLGVLGEMRNVRVLEEELRRAKDFAKGKMVLALEDSFRVASFFASQELMEKQILLPEEVLSKLEAVTEEEVMAVAKDLFKEERLNLAVIGPFAGEDKFEKLLKI